MLLGLIAVSVGACGWPGGIGVQPLEELPPIGAEPEGVVIPPRGETRAIECRRVPRDHCASVGVLEDGANGIALRDVNRVVVSCHIERCDAGYGLFRIDVVFMDGRTQLIGNGGWGSPGEAVP